MIYGNDYETKDGTCVRDYIHVTDLASAHIKVFYCRLFGYVVELDAGAGLPGQEQHIGSL
jgi:UDP-glucose 4-epimerase